MQPAIRVENLAKRYLLGARQRDAYRTLREAVMDGISRPFQRRRYQTAKSSNALWALKDVSFEVAPGEVIGIIGGNGAGKSTLLKILSRITEPTTGRAEIRGRVGSLLEVGTGFHPELTGRENVFLAGAILGMARREIQRKFDQIAEFAGVERFLDTPVKRYSSGMYVRLAFAVAAHLEPEVLLVDEVLAVGDATYQHRCIARMAELARSGRTVLVVSHNMDLVPRMCRLGILVEKGQVVEVGPAHEVVDHYLSRQLENGEEEDLTSRRHGGDGRARFTRLRLIGRDGRPRATHISGEDLIVRIEVEAKQDLRDIALAAVIRARSGTQLFTSWTREAGFPVDLGQGKQEFECRFERVRLRPGQRVVIMLWMEANGVLDSVEEARVVDILDSPDTRDFSNDLHQGLVLCDYRWRKLTPNEDLTYATCHGASARLSGIPAGR